MFPVVRFPTEMHHCDDQDQVVFDCVENAVRENVRDASANILIDDAPAFCDSKFGRSHFQLIQ